MARQLFVYELPDEVLTYLIGASVEGSSERQLAAKLLLDCLRRYRTKDEIEACLEETRQTSILEIVPEARRLASHVGLLH
jgi:hypothetical protein